MPYIYNHSVLLYFCGETNLFRMKRRIKSSNNNNDRSIKKELTPLYPKDDIDISKYENILDSALSDEKCLNIAITGSYGAGKSSLINTYEKKRNDYFTRISLAHFSPIENDNDGDNTNPEGKLEAERILEGKILNQLIHQTEKKNIPLTRFKIKNINPWPVIFGYCVAVAVFILLFVFCIFKDSICSFIFVGKENIPWVIDSIAFRICTLSILIGIGVFLLYKIVSNTISIGGVKKLNIKGNEIELFDGSKDSFFDRYLDEILYLLIKQKSDVIVFEDIDRFDNNLIFERLREINTLANIKLCDSKRNSNRKLHFLYLLKDDMFSSKDRTKFFDIIIPVVPFINGTNSYDVFLEKFETLLDTEESNEGIEKDFLMGASLYVDEMRFLINICNEFKTYDNVINIGHLDRTKLLAIIIYKNLFPKDFEELQLGKGFLHDIINDKETIIGSLKTKINEKIKEIDNRIQNANNEIINSEEELKILYAGKKFQNAYSAYFSDYVEGVPDNLSTDAKKEYEERLKRVKDKAFLVNGNLESGRHVLQKQLSDINAFSFSKLIKEQYGSMESFINEINASNKWNERYKDIQDSVYFGYVKFAVGNGYIDEKYSDYIQVFRGNSVRYEDKKFLMSIVENNKQALDYKLHDAKLVLDSIGEAYFSYGAILNYDLIRALLKSNYDEKKERLITQLKEDNNYDFIYDIWGLGEERNQLVECIATWWPSFFGEVSKLGDKYSSLTREFSYIALSILNDKLLKSVDENGDLSSYISNSPDYLGGVKNEYDVVINHLVLLNVCFVSIGYMNYPEDLIAGVYENNLYEINYGNIRFFVNRYYGISDEEEIKHKNYSVLKKEKESPLINYIQNYFETYVASYTKFCDGAIHDEEQIALQIINDKNLSEEIRKEYISNYKGIISNLDDIDESLHKDSVMYGIVLCSFNNIITYSDRFDFDDYLIALINNNEIVFESNEDEIKHCLSYKVYSADGLKFERYKELVPYAKTNELTSVPRNLNEEKIRFLIKEGIISFSRNTLAEIRDNYRDCLGIFIENNLNRESDIRYELDSNDLISVLDSEINIDSKKIVVDLIGSEISIIDRYQQDKLTAYIVNINKDKQSEFSEVLSKYDAFGEETKKEIERKILLSPNVLLNNLEKASINLRKSLLHNCNMKNRLSMLASLLSDLSDDEIKGFLSEIGVKGLSRIMEDNKTTTVEEEEGIYNFLDKMKKNKKIESYYTKTDKKIRIIIRKD